MTVKFIANPYAYLGYYQLAEATDFEITMYNRNAGIQFNFEGIYESTDEAEIKALRQFIKTRTVDIAEYDEQAGKEPLLKEPIKEQSKPTMTYEEQELREKFIALVRL